MRIRQQATGPWSQALHSVLVQENGIRYGVVDIVRSSRVLTYCLALSTTGDLHKLTSERMEEAVALKLGVEAVRIARSRGVVAVEVQLPPAYHRPLLVRSLKRKDRLWLTLGQTAQGSQVRVNLRSPRYPHALLAATTGGGKTEAMKLAAWELVMQNEPEDLQVLVIDGKGGSKEGQDGWAPFRQVSPPHLVHPIVSEPHEALRALAWAMTEADRRKAGGSYPALVVFVDEVRELLVQAGGADGAAAQALQKLTQIGRSLDIHILMATQHPTVDVLGGSLAKANLPLRLVGRVMDAGASNLASGQKGLRAHRLYGAGDFLAVDGVMAHRFQVALVDERHMANLPRNGTNPHEIDLTLDLDRVVGVMNAPSGEPQVPARMAAWAVFDYLQRQDQLDAPSAKAIRDQFRVGTPRAQAIRDYASVFMAELRGLGGGLLVTGNPVA